MVTLKSESANKTQQNNAKILFGSKGVAILAKLETFSKEKTLATTGVDAVLNVLKTKDTALLEKFANSKTGKTLAKNCRQLAAAKTFDAIMKNIKQIKPLKSFDKFTSPVKAVKGKGDIRVGLITEDEINAAIERGRAKAKAFVLDVNDPNSYMTALTMAGDDDSPKFKKLKKQIETFARKLGKIPRNWEVNLSPYAVEVEGHFLEIYPNTRDADDLSDMHVICLGGLTDMNRNLVEWSPRKGSVAVIEQIDFDEVGEVKRMSFEKALRYVKTKNASM